MYGHQQEHGHLASRLSLKIIGNDMDRSGISDFPLIFHSNHGPMLWTLQLLDPPVMICRVIWRIRYATFYIYGDSLRQFWTELFAKKQFWHFDL